MLDSSIDSPVPLGAQSGSASAGTAAGYSAAPLAGTTSPYTPVDEAWTWNGIVDDSPRVTQPEVAKVSASGVVRPLWALLACLIAGVAMVQ